MDGRLIEGAGRGVCCAAPVSHLLLSLEFPWLRFNHVGFGSLLVF
jgi:hypothetical protein